MKRRLIVLLFALPILSIAQGLPSASDMLRGRISSINDELVVRIGHVGPTSGPIEQLGIDSERAARMAVEQLNAVGVKIQGRPARFILVTEDDGSDPSLAVSAAHRLVESGVVGVVGHLNSGASIPAASVYNVASIPQVSPATTNPKFTRLGFEGVFRLVADDDALGHKLGAIAIQRFKGKRIHVIDDRTAYGAGLAASFIEGLRSVGGNIIGRSYLPQENRNFSYAAEQAAKDRPDIVFFGGMDEEAGLLLQEFGRIGIRPLFMGGDGICSPDLPTLARGNLSDNDIVCAEAGGVTAKEQALLDRFRDQFQTRFGSEPSVYSSYAYDAVMVLANAMKFADSIEPKRYLRALKRESYDGVTGKIKFDSKGDITNAAVTVMTYRRGQRITAGVVR